MCAELQGKKVTNLKINLCLTHSPNHRHPLTLKALQKNNLRKVFLKKIYFKYHFVCSVYVFARMAFFLCFLVTILVFIHRYYSMMMVRVKCGTGRSSGSRIRRIRGSTAVRFSSYSWLFQDQVFVFLLSSLGRPLQAMRVWWQTGTLYNRAGVAPVRLNTVYAL